MKNLISLFCLFTIFVAQAQNVMSPQLLWSLGRLGNTTLLPDNKTLVYSVKKFNIEDESSITHFYVLDILTGKSEIFIENAKGVSNLQTLKSKPNTLFFKRNQDWVAYDFKTKTETKTPLPDGVDDIKPSENINYLIASKSVKIKSTIADLSPELKKASGKIYDDLMYRHWDSWNDEYTRHPFILTIDKNKYVSVFDILKEYPYSCPTNPFGGSEDYIISADGKTVYYVTKEKFGKEYAKSTNTDIFQYDINKQEAINLTKDFKGYDKSPQLSPDGTKLAWLSMPRDGYEADKNRLMILDLATKKYTDLTLNQDITVNQYIWSNDGQSIFAIIPQGGTQPIIEFKLGKDFNQFEPKKQVKTISSGNFNYTAIFDAGTHLITTREDMNHASDIWSINKKNGQLKQLTQINADVYNTLKKSNIEKRMVTTTDGKEMLVWVILPPDFDPNKKYPALLYCQGGPQSQVSQYYSYRWNFQLMAAQGYVVIAPNRRGLPGFGQEWNESISKDWGGQPMRDYLSAVDSISKEKYIDTERIGAVGASYGGYSVYMLAGIHNKRFKTFISHCGLYNLESWYGTTEELWFADFDIGGPYWDLKTPDSYGKHSPHRYVSNWDTPIMVIHGGRDYRVPDTQGLEAYQSAQLKGIKSRLLYFPDEGHWVLKPHNALLWHKEFYRWLKETL
jgi:dipeptidyl aminopeptidase/acylaminoacyl peptidase